MFRCLECSDLDLVMNGIQNCSSSYQLEGSEIRMVDEILNMYEGLEFSAISSEQYVGHI